MHLPPARLLAKLRRGLDYVASPRLILARSLGIDVGFVAELLEIRDRLQLSPRSIVDVGASEGNFAFAARWLFPDAEIHAFEPNPALHASLERKLGQDARAHIHEVALSCRSELRTFHVTGAHQLASLLPPTPSLRTQFGREYTEQTTMQVRTARLDERLATVSLPEPSLLKIDVQGAELEVLQGAGALLSRFSAVKLEVNFSELYTGQAHFLELVALLRDHGFSSFLQQGVQASEGRPVWCDMVFVH